MLATVFVFVGFTDYFPSGFVFNRIAASFSLYRLLTAACLMRGILTPSSSRVFDHTRELEQRADSPREKMEDGRRGRWKETLP